MNKYYVIMNYELNDQIYQVCLYSYIDFYLILKKYALNDSSEVKILTLNETIMLTKKRPTIKQLCCLNCSLN